MVVTCSWYSCCLVLYRFHSRDNLPDMGRNLKDLTGQKFGKLMVIRYIGAQAWDCLCECGKPHVAGGPNLKSGKTSSCGCSNPKAFRHGLSKSPEYRTWRNMRQCCYNTKHTLYHLIGRKGIRVCERWMLFDNFFADMGPRPEGHKIKRADSTKNYEPGNCHWVPMTKVPFKRSSID